MLPAVRAGAARPAARSAFQVCMKPLVAAAATEAELVPKVRDVRARIAFYASTPQYRAAFEHHGLGDLADELTAAVARAALGGDAAAHQRRGAAHLRGGRTYAEIGRKLVARYRGLVTDVEFSIPAATPGGAGRCCCVTCAERGPETCAVTCRSRSADVDWAAEAPGVVPASWRAHWRHAVSFLELLEGLAAPREHRHAGARRHGGAAGDERRGPSPTATISDGSRSRSFTETTGPEARLPRAANLRAGQPRGGSFVRAESLVLSWDSTMTDPAKQPPGRAVGEGERLYRILAEHSSDVIAVFDLNRDRST